MHENGLNVFKDIKPAEGDNIIALVSVEVHGDKTPEYMTGTFAGNSFWVDGKVVKNVVLWGLLEGVS